MSDDEAIQTRLSTARWQFGKSCAGLALRCTWPLMICGLVVLVVYVGHIRRLSSGSFRRAEFEAVVARVRGMDLEEGKECWFQVDDWSHPEGLRRRAGPDSRGHVVIAQREGTSLFVAIETSNMGHSGHFGFIYSDRKLVPYQDPSIGPALNVPGFMREIRRQIDDHWWEVYDDLD